MCHNGFGMGERLWKLMLPCEGTFLYAHGKPYSGVLGQCTGKSQIGLSLSSLRSSRTWAERGPDPDRLENHLFASAREVFGSRPLACKIVGFGQGVAVRRRFQPLGLRQRARQGLRPSKLLAGKPCSISSGEKSSATTRWALHRLSKSLRKTLLLDVA